VPRAQHRLRRREGLSAVVSIKVGERGAGQRSASGSLRPAQARSRLLCRIAGSRRGAACTGRCNGRRSGRRRSGRRRSGGRRCTRGRLRRGRLAGALLVGVGARAFGFLQPHHASEQLACELLCAMRRLDRLLRHGLHLLLSATRSLAGADLRLDRRQPLGTVIVARDERDEDSDDERSGPARHSIGRMSRPARSAIVAADEGSWDALSHEGSIAWQPRHAIGARRRNR
jgi:hypothetical protein